MIAYFDTSAFVPLLVDEPTTEAAGRLWDLADRVVAVRLLYLEARATLAQAPRLACLTSAQHRAAVRQLEHRYDELDRLEVDEGLVRRAGDLAVQHALGATMRFISRPPSALRTAAWSSSPVTDSFLQRRGRWDSRQ